LGPPGIGAITDPLRKGPEPLGLQDAADLATAGLDALGLGRVGQRIQGPMRRRLGIGGLEAAVGWRTSPDINAPSVRSLTPSRAPASGTTARSGDLLELPGAHGA